MKTTEHETWTEYHWEVGDLVRLRKPEGRPGKWDHVPAGAFGYVSYAKDGYSVGLSLHGFSRPADSIAATLSHVSRFDLAPWSRQPEDEPAIAARALEVLEALAWVDEAKVDGHSPWSVSVAGLGSRGVDGPARIRTNPVVLGELLPYLGDGTGSLDAPERIDLTVNASGHAFLDAAGRRRSIELAGGGNLHRYAYDRTGVFHVHDIHAKRDHAFDGEAARMLRAANRTEVKWMSDGRMQDIARAAQDYPRTLRAGSSDGVLVVETGEDTLDVRHGDRSASLEGSDARSVRKACGRIAHMGRWFATRSHLLDAPEPAQTAPGGP